MGQFTQCKRLALEDVTCFKKRKIEDLAVVADDGLEFHVGKKLVDFPEHLFFRGRVPKKILSYMEFALSVITHSH